MRRGESRPAGDTFGCALNGFEYAFHLSSIPTAMPILLGIDTGGTYTDAVLFDEESGTVVAAAKALTTRHDLAIGIADAVGSVLDGSNVDAASIALVSLSTTLATNALVEGQGGRVALVLVGFDDAGCNKGRDLRCVARRPLHSDWRRPRRGRARARDA